MISHRLFMVAAAVGALAIAGCSGGPISEMDPLKSVTASNESGASEGRQVVGKPYKVGGRWYTPKADDDYNEVGRASWYGGKFHGRRTANGEIFDRNKLTAAHPTLPLPSFVRVTNKENGKAMVVRLNDRGPFTRNRIIDVSERVAKELDFHRDGHAKVRVEYLGPAPKKGGDRETLIAAKKYGTKSRGGIGGLLPFGRGGDDDDKGGRQVEVRLAAADTAPKADPNAKPKRAIPGIAVRPSPVVVEDNKPVTAPSMLAEETQLAFTEKPEETGAEEALLKMATVDEPKQVAVEPLPENAAAQSIERVAGAFDMFNN